MTPLTPENPPAEQKPPRRLWRSRDERAADRAAALVRKERHALEAQRLREKRAAERVAAKQERRLRGDQQDSTRDKDDARKTDLLTRAAALIATIVAGQGMWQFLDRIIGDVPWPLRALMFAFLEIAVITSAIRARANMRKDFSAGIDGVAVWALTSASAVLAAMEAASLPEAAFRLLAPLVAAWLWERGMAIERRRIRGTSGINWRLTPERVLVWLGLAEARERTASEVDAHRRLTRVALAVKKLHQLRTANASDRKVAAALAKRDRFLDKAVEHTDLARNPRTQTVLLDLVTALGGADSLSDLLGSAAAPWAQIDHPAITGAKRHSEAAALAKETRRLTETVLAGRDPESAATIEMLASMLAGRRIPLPGSGTADKVPPGVADLVAGRVALRPSVVDLVGTSTGTRNGTPDGTSSGTAAEVAPEVSDEEVDAIIAALREEEADDDTGTESGTGTATEGATEAMRQHWDQAIAQGRVPSGAELARVGACDPSYGRRMRREWLDALDGRTRRSLLGPKKVTA